MTKRINAKYKINRRLGCNLWGRPKSPVNRRDSKPGVHGKRRRKLSDYGVQLRAKQCLKGYYGNITEHQFRRYYREATRMQGDSAENLVGLLERRLDTVVYRSMFASTVFASRQLVNHGHVEVNGRRVNIPSYLVREGDVVSVAGRSRNMAAILEALDLQERTPPEYIEVDAKKMRSEFLRVPKNEEVPYPAIMEPNLVIVYYSR